MRKNPSTHDLQLLDAAHHFHPFTDHGALKPEQRRVMTRGDGVWIWDSDGKRYLDGMAGLWCVQVGHGRPEIAEAVRAQMNELAYYNTFFKTTHGPVIRLAEMLAELTPQQFNMAFFGSSGSDGNDTVLRMVRTFWQIEGKPTKRIVISRRNAYHGSSLAGAALGGMASMHGQAGSLPDIVHVDQPYWYGEGQDLSPHDFGLKAARSLEQKIAELGEDNIAAFIAEPVQGAGGVIVPPDSYWPEIRRILKAHDILFVSDEVICGFGRTGKWFGCETFGTEPDLMTMAKGLSSGYLPIGAVMVSDRVAEAFRRGGEFFHGYTYSGHPVACAAAIANLEIMKREKLVERVGADIGPYLTQRWERLAEHPLVGEARMVGLMGGLELVPDKNDRKQRFAPEGEVGGLARDFSFANGLIMRAVRDRLIISPPLVLSHAEADELVRLATRTLDDTLAALKRDGRVA